MEAWADLEQTLYRLFARLKFAKSRRSTAHAECCADRQDAQLGRPE